MQFGQFLDQLTERVKQTVAQQFLERDTLAQLANAAIKMRYPASLLRAKWFWQTSASFTATANVVAKPAYCERMLSVVITNIVGTVTSKEATPVDVRLWDTVNANPVEQGTASNPKFREDGASIFLVPYQNSTPANFTGVFHYLRNFGTITDETFELSYPNVDALPVLPWWEEEDAMFDAVKLVKLRARGIMAEPSSVALVGADYQKTMDALRAGDDPLAIWRANLAGTGNGQ